MAASLNSINTGDPPQENVDFDEAVVMLKEKVKRRVLVREMFIYFIFFAVFILQLFLARQVKDAFDVQSTMLEAINEEEFGEDASHIFKKFSDVMSIEEFWDWSLTVLAPVLSKNEWYDGSKFSTDDERLIFYTNRIVGAVRFRQLRVKEGLCARADTYKPIYPKCYGAWDSTTNDASSYGPGTAGFSYMNEEQVKAPSILGKAMPIYYAGAGFVADIDISNSTLVESQISALKSQKWIDRQTRVVFVTINVYNGNVNLFSTVQFMVEMTPGGRVTGLPLLQVFRLDPYVTSTDVLRLILFIVMIVILLYFTIREIMEFVDAKKIYRSYLMYFSSGWNVLDVANYILFWIMVFEEFFGYMANPNRLDLDLTTNAYVNLEWVAYNYIAVFTLQAFNVFFTFLKAFKYLQLNDRMNVLWSTLGKASGDLLAFLIFFGVVFIGFATVGHLVFGPDVSSFMDLQSSFLSCFRMVIGDFEQEQISMYHRAMGPMYFIVFVILVYFALVNMFLAIINDAYMYVNRELRGTQTLTKQMKKGIRKKWMEFIDTLLRRERGKSDEELLQRLQSAPIGHNSVLSAEELKMALGGDLTQLDIERIIYIYHNMRTKVLRRRAKDSDDIELKQLLPSLKEIHSISQLQQQLTQHQAIMQSKIDMIVQYLGAQSVPPPGANIMPPPPPSHRR